MCIRDSLSVDLVERSLRDMQYLMVVMNKANDVFIYLVLFTKCIWNAAVRTEFKCNDVQ